jgi:deoxyribodipyrimidine photo-lyase
MSAVSHVPSVRIRPVNEAPVRQNGGYVLYWMMANRRSSWNYSLDRALEWAGELGIPLLVFEALRSGYRWASDRLHRFVIDGMEDNRRAFEKSPIVYYPYLEPHVGAGEGLLSKLASKAAVVITDDYPCFFLPRAVKAAAMQIDIRLEAVDSNGLLPLRVADRVFPTAYAFRRFLQKFLPEHLVESPRARPLSHLDIPSMQSVPRGITRNWPTAIEYLDTDKRFVDLPIDHNVSPVGYRGGSAEGSKVLRRFLARLSAYDASRNHPDEEATSRLSPYLHFGHVSVHEVFAALARHESWSARHLKQAATGSRSGWWGLGPSAEGFLDELVTWREVGFNMAWQRDDFEEFESLPEWAKETLLQHSEDPRPHLYTLEEFETGRTHDPLWNAAQTELVREGRIHNYLRMLWGKKILEWSRSPREALEVMLELNNKYAVDGRDPNSASGIFWVLGRYDRAWGPERPIFGKVRYMSSQNTARKVRLKKYLERYATEEV